MPKLSDPLTDKGVAALKPKDKKYFKHDGKDKHGKHGLAICVYPTGTKSWFFIYGYEKKKCFMPLGTYPDMTLAERSEERRVGKEC